MRFLILLVFCFGVKANVPKTLTDSCGLAIKSIYDVGLTDNENDVTNTDYIKEPCDYKDIDCIREFMAENSKCKPVYGPIPDPLYIPQVTISYPNSNLSLTFTKTTGTGLSDASIESFFLNEKTNVLVFAISIPTFFFDIPKLYFTFRRPGEESICKYDYSNATYESLIFTANIPKIDGKYRLDMADAKHGYVGNANPDFYIGPKAYTSNDPIVQAEFESFLETLPLDTSTSFLFTSELYILLYIQTYICDFGIKLYIS